MCLTQIPGTHGSDYINASFIDVRLLLAVVTDTLDIKFFRDIARESGTLQHKVRQEHFVNISILQSIMKMCKGPLKEIVEDFWRMVWQYRVKTIMMLTRCVEMGKVSNSLFTNKPTINHPLFHNSYR